MIKNCEVLVNNDYITVINYDGRYVQIPSINKKAKYVNVIFRDGRYTIVDDKYTEIKSTKNKSSICKTTKKTTIERNYNNK